MTRAPQKRRRSCLERLRNDVDGARPFLDVYDITLYVDSRENERTTTTRPTPSLGCCIKGLSLCR